MADPRPIWDQSLVLVTGKGGVGKTTVTVALARRARAAGKRVLVAEVVPDTHNPSPVLSHFGHARHKGEAPVQMQPGLFGVRLAPSVGHRLFLRHALKIRLLVEPAIRSSALTRFLLAAPTFPEIGVLYQLVDLLRSRAYDHIIVDLPATGLAIGLASLPRTVLKIVPSGLIGDAIRQGLEHMTDPARTWAVVVTIPESMPVTETSDLITGLYKVGIRIGATVLNQMPSQVFEGPEREALSALFEQQKNILGRRELVRLDRAQSARQDFHRAMPSGVPRFEIPRLPGTAHEADVIKHVEAQLAAFESGEPADSGEAGDGAEAAGGEGA